MQYFRKNPTVQVKSWVYKIAHEEQSAGSYKIRVFPKYRLPKDWIKSIEQYGLLEFPDRHEQAKKKIRKSR